MTPLDNEVITIHRGGPPDDDAIVALRAIIAVVPDVAPGPMPDRAEISHVVIDGGTRITVTRGEGRRVGHEWERWRRGRIQR